jgi:hypothetical protein
VLSVTAAVTATAAAGYYAYNQYSKRFPRYQQQLEAFEQVGGPSVCVALVTSDRQLLVRPNISQNSVPSQTVSFL